jgi:hypothetical protein
METLPLIDYVLFYVPRDMETSPFIDYVMFYAHLEMEMIGWLCIDLPFWYWGLTIDW